MAQGTYESDTGVAGAETNGWIAFAAFILMLNGFFSVLGLAAVLNSSVVNVGGHGVTVWDFSAWGWINLILGVLMAVVGLGLFSGSGVSRWFAVGLVMVNAIAQFGYASAFPLWALLVITLDVVIIYQLLVNWRPQTT